MNNQDDRQQRLDAVNYARASIGLEGFTPSTLDEQRATAYIDGLITLEQLVNDPDLAQTS